MAELGNPVEMFKKYRTWSDNLKYTIFETNFIILLVYMPVFFIDRSNGGVYYESYDEDHSIRTIPVSVHQYFIYLPVF